MISINSALIDLKRLDLMARGGAILDTIDARAKVLVTLVFVVCVVSFNRYELSALLPFFIFPSVMIAISSIPLLFIVRKIALLSPFVLIAGLFNILFDPETMLHIGSLNISGGWISFFSITVRSVLTISAAFILVGSTGFTAVCQALEQLGMPQLFAVQLLFLYRYIFVLADEGNRASRSRDLRSCGRKGLGIKSYGSLVGHLLLRTWQRAERIHTAMLARGFRGEFHATHPTRLGFREFGFIAIWSALLILLRIRNFSDIMGSLINGFFQ